MSKARNWIITLNNPDLDVEDYALALKLSGATWFVGQLEKGEEGTVHLQAAFGYKDPVRFSTIKKILPQAHIEKTNCGASAAEYCSKSETRVNEPHTFGTPPVKRNTKNHHKVRTQQLLDKGALQALQDGDISLREFKLFKANIELAKAEIQNNENLDKLQNFWYYGPPGTGKSLKARRDNSNHFPKPANKWWDGYNNQPVVIIDDLDSNALGHHLKIWADHYPFVAEFKGGAQNIRPNQIIVTSNYSIQELFGDNPKMAEAIARRFT